MLTENLSKKNDDFLSAMGQTKVVLALIARYDLEKFRIFYTLEIAIFAATGRTSPARLSYASQNCAATAISPGVAWWRAAWPGQHSPPRYRTYVSLSYRRVASTTWSKPWGRRVSRSRVSHMCREIDYQLKAVLTRLIEVDRRFRIQLGTKSRR
jgi:hypothetical protein